MEFFLDALHFLGTKSLVVSILAQCVVIGVAIKNKSNPKIVQGTILLLGLVLLVAAIAMRPPSPIDILPDSLGTASAFMFAVPAISALRRMNKPKEEQP